VVVAYDMYKEVVEEAFAEFGFATKEEAVKKCGLDFYSFRDRLAIQGLLYNPEDKRYKGDAEMRVNTKRGEKASREGERRGRGRPKRNVTPDGDSDSDGEYAAGGIGTVTRVQLNALKRPLNGRLCGDLNKYLYHRENIKTVKHALKCVFCGQLCYTKCGVCNLAAHDNPNRGEFTGFQCFTHIHNDQYFGLAWKDCKLLKTHANEWTEPSQDGIEKNSHHLHDIQRKVPYCLRARSQVVEDSI
jgi:hypothetical protein